VDTPESPDSEHKERRISRRQEFEERLSARRSQSFVRTADVDVLGRVDFLLQPKSHFCDTLRTILKI
jgi:hypothetical protein